MNIKQTVFSCLLTLIALATFFQEWRELFYQLISPAKQQFICMSIIMHGGRIIIMLCGVYVLVSCAVIQ